MCKLSPTRHSRPAHTRSRHSARPTHWHDSHTRTTHRAGSSKRWPPDESGFRKEVAVPCASDWMYSVTRKTTGMKRPRITARNAAKETSRPIVPPSAGARNCVSVGMA